MQLTRGKKAVKVTPAQAEVYDALVGYAGKRGWPDHILVPVVQHTGALHQHSSGIRTRRLELERLQLVQQAGQTQTNSGRTAVTFVAVR
jgi:hypothetical protein